MPIHRITVQVHCDFQGHALSGSYSVSCNDDQVAIHVRAPDRVEPPALFFEELRQLAVSWLDLEHSWDHRKPAGAA